jgi:hypothetical protein
MRTAQCTRTAAHHLIQARPCAQVLEQVGAPVAAFAGILELLVAQPDRLLLRGGCLCLALACLALACIVGHGVLALPWLRRLTRALSLAGRLLLCVIVLGCGALGRRLACAGFGGLRCCCCC